MASDLTYTCDRCHDECWADACVRLGIYHADEEVEITICRDCVGEMAAQVGTGKSEESEA